MYSRKLGWFKVDRDVFSDPLFRDSEVFKFWVYILSKANYVEKDIVKYGHIGRLGKGQLLMTFSEASLVLGIDRSKIQRSMKKLVDGGFISVSGRIAYSVIEVIHLKA